MALNLPEGEITAVMLGNAQDAGLPHAGCRCANCLSGDVAYATCLAIVDRRQSQAKVWLIDVTPDIKFQLNLLADVLGQHPKRPSRLRQPDGVFITHAHMGHIGGLPQLSIEGMFVQEMPLYGSAALIALLDGTALWKPLTRNLVMEPLTPNEPLVLGDGLTITAVPVPHRDEWGVGTFAFQLQGPNASLLYLPDIDSWEEWEEAEERLTAVDTAIVDAAFYSKEELGGRDPVAHPYVPHTLNLYQHVPTQLVLTHFNHTNPIYNPQSAEYAEVISAGVQIAKLGQTFQL